jgi:hypothetical protein
MPTRTFAPRTTSGETVTRYDNVASFLINCVLTQSQTLFWNDKVNYHKKDE